MLIKDNRATSRWSTSCWRRAPCCTPRPNGTGVLFHSAGPGARPLGVTRNPWKLRSPWAASILARRPACRALIMQREIVVLERISQYLQFSSCRPLFYCAVPAPWRSASMIAMDGHHRFSGTWPPDTSHAFMRSLTTGISSSANAASALSSARRASKASSAMASRERALRSRIRRNAKLRLRHSRYALRGANSTGSVCPADEASAQVEGARRQRAVVSSHHQKVADPNFTIDSAGGSITIGHRSGRPRRQGTRREVSSPILLSTTKGSSHWRSATRFLRFILSVLIQRAAAW
jgi:hypothetical protein